MVVLEGESDNALDEQMEAIAELAEELKCLDILVVDTPTLKRGVWAAHDAFHTSMETAKSSGELNIDVPTEQIAALVDFAKSLGAEKGLSVMCYAHAGSGGLHIHTVSDAAKADFAPAMASLAEAVYKKCAELGGDIVGEYGVGYSKREALKALSNAAEYAKLTAEKAAFDPKNILNPGKVVIL